MERKYLFGIQDDGKTAGMVSYFFIIGWSIGYFGFHQNNKTSLSSYHLRQTLFLYLSYLTIRFGITLCPDTVWQAHVIFSRFYFMVFLNITFIILWTIGLIGASNAEKKPIPILGPVAQTVFSSI